MTQKTTYRVINPLTQDDAVNQLNNLLSQISVRLDSIEGYRGTVTLASGTYDVKFDTPQATAGYQVLFTGNASETLYVTGKSTLGFTINSSNASSTASVDYAVLLS